MTSASDEKWRPFNCFFIGVGLRTYQHPCWRKNAAGRSSRGSCSCMTMPRLTYNPEEAGLPGLPLSWSPTLFSGSGPVGLPRIPWTEKTIERSPFFIRRGGQCCRGDLVGRTTFWIVFFLVACKSSSNGLRSLLSFVGSIMNKSRVWSL